MKTFMHVKAEIAGAKNVEDLRRIVETVNEGYLADVPTVAPFDWQVFTDLLRKRMQELEAA